MLKIINRLLVISLALLFVVGCSDADVATPEPSAGDGALSLTISRSGDQQGDAMEHATLRIYNSSSRLIARYHDDEIPAAIYLAQGSYKATVEVGEWSSISDKVEDVTYYGEKEFSIEGGKLTSLDIDCGIQNSVVEVIFDESVAKRFELGAICHLCVADEFSREDAEASAVPTLTFTEDGRGYFILPEGAKNIAWGFYGSSEYEDPYSYNPSTTVEFDGVIPNVEKSALYTLRFIYTQIVDGYMDMTVSLDESLDEFDDNLSFAPQPSVVGRDFDVAAEELLFAGQNTFTFDVKSYGDIRDIVISSDDMSQSIAVMSGGVVNSEISGVSYVAANNKGGELTLSSAFAANFAGYGSKSVNIAVTDIGNSSGSSDVALKVSGMQPSVCDYWANTAQLSAQVMLDVEGDVVFAYRAAGGDEWTEVTAQKSADDDYTYTAQSAEPVWASSTNEAKLPVYTLAQGFSAKSTYEYKLKVNGLEFATYSHATGGGDSIPYGNMENGNLPSFTTNSSASTSWASGNNNTTKTLCTQATKGGSKCAYLQSTNAVITLAAGNLAFGQFEMASTTSGRMSLGQSFDWKSRPRTFKFRYAASLGKVDYKHEALGEYDKARVYMAIVDWGARHAVTSSTSSATGLWDPATQTKTDEGNIIGYASLFIEQNTSGSGLVEVEVPVQYYDHVTKPSGKITIVISCAASAYGDLMKGSTSSALWLDDFEFGY